MKRIALLAILFIVGAQGTINGPLDFEADYQFAEGLGAGNITLVSSAPTVDYIAINGTFGAFNVEAFAITDLTRACWDLNQYYLSGEQNGVGCASSPTGDLEMRIVDNGSVAYKFPTAVTGQFKSDHSLGYPVDFGFAEKLKDMGLGEVLLLSNVNGEMGLLSAPAFTGTGTSRDTYGLLAPINDETVVQIYQNGVLIHSTGANQQFLVFDSILGAQVQPYKTPFVLVPFEAGSTALLEQAESEAAREGFNLQKLQGDLQSLSDASGGTAEEVPSELGNIEILLSEILAGGIISVPGDFEALSELIEAGEIIRIYAVTLTNQNGLSWEGTAALQIRGGTVEGADSLIFLLPWWSFLLWGVAVALFITKLVLHKPKKGPIDKFAWIGWVGTILMSFLLFWLWDLEVRAVWGTSLLTTNAGTEGLAATALLQLVPWALVAVAVTLPLRIIGSSTVNIAGLGKAARLPAVLMPVFGFLLGATLLLDFMGALLEFAVDKL